MKRSFKNNDKICDFYKTLRQNQTYQYNLDMRNRFKIDPTNQMTVYDAMTQLDKFVDHSDPDIHIPNFYHAFQTAESMRKDRLSEWLQLTGLIHDLGKVMYLRGDDSCGTGAKEQWGIVGDTFIVGCRIPDVVVYPEFNDLNPDMHDKRYNTGKGIYSGGCGIDNVMALWGHDEYLYRVLFENKSSLPPESLKIIRYHSLYPWHKEGAYVELESMDDAWTKELLNLFNQYDLYSKTNTKYSQDQLIYLQNYYGNLVEKFIGKNRLLSW